LTAGAGTMPASVAAGPLSSGTVDSADSIARLTAERDEARTNVLTLQAECSRLQQLLGAAEALAGAEIAKLEAELRAAGARCVQHSQARERLERAFPGVRASLRALQQLHGALRNTAAAERREVEKALHRGCSAAAAELQRLHGEVQELSRSKVTLEAYQREVCERKRLHNVVVQLRGNIRVICRARPVVADRERSYGEACEFRAAADGRIGVWHEQMNGYKAFEFDEVFTPASTQEQVHTRAHAPCTHHACTHACTHAHTQPRTHVQVFEGVEPLVTSVLDGYDVCECVRAFVCVRVRAFVRACACARVRAFVCACACVRAHLCVCARSARVRALACACACSGALMRFLGVRGRARVRVLARLRDRVHMCMCAVLRRTDRCVQIQRVHLCVRADRLGQDAHDARARRRPGRQPARAAPTLRGAAQCNMFQQQHQQHLLRTTCCNSSTCSV